MNQSNDQKNNFDPNETEQQGYAPGEDQKEGIKGGSDTTDPKDMGSNDDLTQ